MRLDSQGRRRFQFRVRIGRAHAGGTYDFPLRLAVIARHHFDDVRLPFPPVWMHRVGLALGAPAGRLLGYHADFAGATPREAALAL